MIRNGATLIAVLLCAGPLLAGKEDPYCAPLADALAAARAGDGFLAITGMDAGLYSETTLALPGAKLCTTNPRESPPVWRCHMGSEDRYTIALQDHAELLRRIEACLGSTWTSERIQDRGYLRLDTISKGGDAPRVRIATTGPPKYRLFLTVLAAEPGREP